MLLVKRRRNDFNPRSPHGERQAVLLVKRRRNDFNPRSPHGERRDLLSRRLFLFTISIHAPRTGSDSCFL